MVAARYLEDWLKRRLERQQERFRAEGRDEGRAEGQARERELWLDWRRRFIEAQERGLPFNEPPSRRGGHRPPLKAIIGGAATSSLTTVEAPKITIVAARYLEDWLKRRLERQQEKWRAEGRAEGRTQGRAEARAEEKEAGRAQGIAEARARERELWLDWHRRFIEAQEQGLPFNEPPPSGEQTDGS